MGYLGPFEGTEAVWDWWDDRAKQHTFHFEPAWEGEVKGETPQFYAFREQANPNLAAVYDFWDKVNNQHTFHFPPAWKNEEERSIQFYAYANESAVYKEPTPSPTPAAPPATAALKFVTDKPNELADSADFLAKCTRALKAAGKDAECVSVEEGNEGGVEITVAGSQETVDELEAVGGWKGVDLPEVTRMAPTGAQNPTVDIESVDNSTNTTLSAAVGPGRTLMYVGATAIVTVA